MTDLLQIKLSVPMILAPITPYVPTDRHRTDTCNNNPLRFSSHALSPM